MAEEEGARARLQAAALALFAEQGFERTTAAAIAARAGVTERTFFRHFADKREALFDGQARLRAALTEAIAGASAGAPLALLFAAFRAAVPMLEANRSFAGPRQAVIAATPALAERETAKHAALADDLAAALRARGVAALPATLAAQAGMAAFTQATLAWLADDAAPLTVRIDEAERALTGLLDERRRRASIPSSRGPRP